MSDPPFAVGPSDDIVSAVPIHIGGVNILPPGLGSPLAPALIVECCAVRPRYPPLSLRASDEIVHAIAVDVGNVDVLPLQRFRPLAECAVVE
jgi:hypothetical protein